MKLELSLKLIDWRPIYCEHGNKPSGPVEWNSWQLEQIPFSSFSCGLFYYIVDIADDTVSEGRRINEMKRIW
jgi:hypothetical protein